MARKRIGGAVAESIYEGELWSDPEAILQTIEQRDRSAVNPAMGCVLQRAVGVLQSSDGAADKATFTIVTRDKTRNRHGNMVQIAPSDVGGGLLLDQYARNPIVLFDHGMGGMTIPIGLSETPDGALTVKLSKGKATAEVYFSKLPHAQIIAAAVHEKILRMASVGFNPRKAMRLKPAKQEELPDGVEDLTRYQGMGLDFVEAELMEWSVTPVGADRGALRQSLDRGKIHDVPLSPYMRQAFAAYAGEKAVWSPGWSPLLDGVMQRVNAHAGGEGDDEAEDVERREVDGIVLEGPTEAIDAFLGKQSASPTALDVGESGAAPVDTDAGIGTTSASVSLVSIEAVAQTFERIGSGAAVVPQTIDAAALLGLLTQKVETLIDSRLAPATMAVQRIEQELVRMTGRVD